jgi:hypothetical protein
MAPGGALYLRAIGANVSHADYLEKLRSIRQQIRSGHVNAVMQFPKSNPREELPQILSTYETIQALDRMIEAEEARAAERDSKAPSTP